MFLSNKYTRIYYSIISNAKNQQRSKQNGFYERHHIHPKSLGGTNLKENLVLLTPREHVICHWLLTKMVEGRDRYKMYHAFHKTAMGNQYRMPSRLIERARINHAIATSAYHKGKVLSPETKAKQSAAAKRHGNRHNIGVKRSEETKQRMREAHKGRCKGIPWSQARREAYERRYCSKCII